VQGRARHEPVIDKMSDNKAPQTKPAITQDLRQFWVAMPHKTLFFILLLAWLALFHFWGNSTLGYKSTPSLFGWLDYCYQTPDDAHGQLIPFVVLALFWWKRESLLKIPKGHWWPALIGVVLALMLHIVGFKIQQTRVSVAAFFLGLYGIMGIVWGRPWLLHSFFPFFLFGFCIPLRTLSDEITFPLRLMATSTSAWISQTILGINVMRQGTILFDANGSYQYEVAAACSGLRSLIAIIVLATIYGFMNYGGAGRRLLIIAAALPLAVVGNILRLLVIIIAAETFGQSAGNYAHESALFSLLPYVPVFAGLPLLGYYLREPDASGITPVTGEPKTK
jgi:exosortase